MLSSPESVSGYQLINLAFDGRKYGRLHPENCPDEHEKGYNLKLRGSDFVVDTVWTQHALCGSGMEVGGSTYEIKNSYFLSNGFEEGQHVYGAWSDGLTLGQCTAPSGSYSRVHDNYFEDNTDIDLIIGQGQNCLVYDNVIVHNHAFAFGGLMLGFDGDHSGSVVSNNTVISNRVNLLGFGILVGHHPWTTSMNIGDAGTVQNNHSSGSAVTFAIDGIANGLVNGNTVNGNQGDRHVFGICPMSAAYTAGDFGSAIITGGYTPRVYHESATQPEIACP
jgi:hypothetical protein